MLRRLLLSTSAALAISGCPSPMMETDAAVPLAPDASRDAFSPIDAGPGPAPPIDLVADLADPFAPARLRPGTPFLVSSREPEPPEGLLNRDHSYYVRDEDGRHVMIDREGPGVITRWWMTIGDLPGPMDPENVVVRLWVDDVEIDPDGGEPGITLGALTNGELEGLAAPFTLGREGTSGGFVVSQPIHYQRSFRADVTPNPGWTYFQFEGFDYESDVEVVPFTFPLEDEALGNLEAAATLWRDHDHPGTEQIGDLFPLLPGTSGRTTWLGPGVVTELALTVMRSARDDVTLVVVVDGEEVLRAPLSWVSGGEDPGASTHESALFAVDPSVVRLYLPIPFEDSFEASLLNESTRLIDGVRMASRAVMAPLDRDLGRFHADCGTHGPVDSIAMCGTNDPSLRAPNNVVASWSGARGHYVGHSLVQRVASSWWCALEPDHEVWIDGRYALLGTGMEDYYSAGFYFMNGPISWSLAGASGWTRSDVDASAATHVYRHHLVDTIPFEDELRFEFESYVDDTTFTGCAYFYTAPE